MSSGGNEDTETVVDIVSCEATVGELLSSALVAIEAIMPDYYLYAPPKCSNLPPPEYIAYTGSSDANINSISSIVSRLLRYRKRWVAHPDKLEPTIQVTIRRQSTTDVVGPLDLLIRALVKLASMEHKPNIGLRIFGIIETYLYSNSYIVPPMFWLLLDGLASEFQIPRASRDEGYIQRVNSDILSRSIAAARLFFGFITHVGKLISCTATDDTYEKEYKRAVLVLPPASRALIASRLYKIQRYLAMKHRMLGDVPTYLHSAHTPADISSLLDLGMGLLLRDDDSIFTQACSQFSELRYVPAYSVLILFTRLLLLYSNRPTVGVKTVKRPAADDSNSDSSSSDSTTTTDDDDNSDSSTSNDNSSDEAESVHESAAGIDQDEEESADEGDRSVSAAAPNPSTTPPPPSRSTTPPLPSQLPLSTTPPLPPPSLPPIVYEDLSNSSSVEYEAKSSDDDGEKEDDDFEPLEEYMKIVGVARTATQSAATATTPKGGRRDVGKEMRKSMKARSVYHSSLVRKPRLNAWMYLDVMPSLKTSAKATSRVHIEWLNDVISPTNRKTITMTYPPIKSGDGTSEKQYWTSSTNLSSGKSSIYTTLLEFVTAESGYIYYNKVHVANLPRSVPLRDTYLPHHPYCLIQPIAILNVGMKRRFVVREETGSVSRTFIIESGSLLLYWPAKSQDWTYCLMAIDDDNNNKDNATHDIIAMFEMSKNMLNPAAVCPFCKTTHKKAIKPRAAPKTGKRVKLD